MSSIIYGRWLVWAGAQNDTTTQRQTDSSRADAHANYSELPHSDLLDCSGGFVTYCLPDSTVNIVTHSDTKCKVQLPPKSIPIIKSPWVAVLPPFQPLSDYWVWGELHNQSAENRRGLRGLGKKRKNQIQNTAKNKLKEDFWTAITAHPARPLLQHSRAAVISDRKGY